MPSIGASSSDADLAAFANGGYFESSFIPELLRARAIASRVLGAERVLGFGSPRASDEAYAALLSDDGPLRMVDLEDPLSGA